MKRSLFLIPKMDCPSEEQMIRLKLEDLQSVRQLEFNIPDHTLTVIHEGNPEKIAEILNSLDLGEELIRSEAVDYIQSEHSKKIEKSLLFAVLAINFTLFLAEIITGFFSRSMGLVADSLDMLADSIVYGLSLYAVGHSVSKKKKIAKISGNFQFLLAFMGFAEVIRRFLGNDRLPVFQAMIMMSLIALAGNVASLIILHRRKDSGVHMKASWIFTSNDVIANLGVILAGILVPLTSSNKPDLVIGIIVFIIVANGARRIIHLSK